jgi:(2R)-ethylmalonyl-CoA mutase
MSAKPYQHAPDPPWIFRTYAGHSTAEKSNALYRANLLKGQTGLSVAFDLPTQTGYDPDHILARGEVGKVGVPISHLGDMRALFSDIPLEKMNTSMTINAPAAWLLAMYVALAEELAFARATAISVLDTVKAGGQVPDEDFEIVASRISFFVNAGVRFVTELCKMRSFTKLWDQILLERYGVQDKKARRFRYGVQVNSLGLTEQQPENNVYRILIEALAVTLSKDARCRALQLPAWNEALGLPRPFDQQWSLRLQQVLAYETDLLEYEDLFDGSHVVEAKVAELSKGALEQLALIDDLGGASNAIDYMKSELVSSNAKRVRSVETGDMTVVGVNRWTDTEASPLSAGESSIETVDPRLEADVVARIKAWREARDAAAVDAAVADLKAAARDGRNVMEPSIVAAKAGVTTGEWSGALREVFGEYRGPTGVAIVVSTNEAEDVEAVKREVERVSEVLGRTLTYLVGKPGLDGHSNGAEQIATRARACGMEVVYDGIRSTPEEIVRRAKESRVHVVGLSILSGSHLDLVQEVIRVMRAEGLGDIPVVAGGIIPPDDALILKQMGVARIYTPKDFKITEIMGDVVKLVEATALERA